ncbi:hypothetical protein M011DRAFT_138892 [Sporormia fimetaria CBS 119925]|uniref:Uncharacterized protein n=1 Tax=Sporormia fimetaria CBS 119925 TaxID=1340428 RepID=A0A6A6V8Q0_9PLEO|nr:hypothetical protein M011DRAFT_138892 [Sporormia fimetaria CBS 119925]
MDRDTPTSTGAFYRLSIELIWAIAGRLETDKDLCAFRAVCWTTRNAIDDGSCSFWRSKFHVKYAMDNDATKPFYNAVLKKEYQHRAKWLKRGLALSFKDQGHSSRELKTLAVLRTLIIESFRGDQKELASDLHGRPLCPNQMALLNFLLGARTFPRVKTTASSPKRREYEGPNPELAAIRLMVGQLMFHTEAPRYDICYFEDSQRAVYEHWNRAPIFTGDGDLQVNMEWALHCFNFFRHHMVREDVNSLYDAMAALEPGDRPSAWRNQISQGRSIMSRHWKGTYSYLTHEELRRLRRDKEGSDEYFVDKNIDEGENIQDLTLDFKTKGEFTWPEGFETRLQSLRPTMALRKTRAQYRSSKTEEPPAPILVQGQGRDHDDTFFASGWLNPLAPQHGIPGWQRVTLMKHYDQGYDNILEDDLWAYEGVVLPGGRIMLGRWWYANDEPTDPDYGSYGGPFILWAVDSAPTFEPED